MAHRSTFKLNCCRLRFTPPHKRVEVWNRPDNIHPKQEQCQHCLTLLGLQRASQPGIQAKVIFLFKETILKTPLMLNSYWVVDETSVMLHTVRMLQGTKLKTL